MNKEFMQKKAVEVLSCRVDSLKEFEMPAQKAVYFCNTTRGGGAVIISSDGSMLFADPFFMDFNEHQQRFLAGERSTFE